jgi:cytochrome b561
MSDDSATRHWPNGIKLLHWLSVLLVVALCVLGFWMQDLPRGPDKISVYALHKSLGLTVLALALVRLTLRARLRGRAPGLPAAMPAWQRHAAHAMQWLLYAILLAMPLSGWLYNSASGFPLKWFGLVALPALGAADPERKALALYLHESFYWVLLGLLALHVGAALQHHFLRRDDILRRMLPRRWLGTDKDRS